MERVSKVLSVAEVVEINRRLISEFGGVFFVGDDNMGNPGSLEHVLEEVQGSIFGQDLYPTDIEKAAVIAYRIIVGHVFHDGNKRTGMEACRLQLDINGYTMGIDFDVIDMALKIAKSNVEFPDFVTWLARRTVVRY